MSGSVNKVILIGHLGQNPEVRRTQDGRPIVTLSIATGESWRDKATGERREKTEWHRVVVFQEGLAKFAEQYLKKGAKVYLEGKMQTREWQDQQGAKRYATEVVLNGFGSVLISLDKADGNRPPPAEDPDAYGTRNTRSTGPAPMGDMDDEIPF